MRDTPGTVADTAHMDDRARVISELDRLPVRTLARELAGPGAPAQEVEQWRRTLYRVKDGKAIDRADRRQLLAERFNVAPSVFASPPRAQTATLGDRLDSIDRTLTLLLTARDEDAAAATERQARLIQLLERLSQGLSDLGRLVAPLDETAQQQGAVPGRRGGRRSA